MTTLRKAGFTPGVTVADVAQKTGLTLDEVRKRAGVDARVTVLDETALDRPFSFPSTTKADAQQLVGRPDKSSGLGKGNTGAGGLLRLKLDGELKKKDLWDARSAVVRTTKEELRARVSTLDEAKAVAVRLGALPHVYGQSVDEMTFHIAEHMFNAIGPEELPAKLGELFATPFAPFKDQPAVIRDLPLDKTKFEHDGQWGSAIAKALVEQGVDSNEKVDELRRRLGMRWVTLESSPSTTLSLMMMNFVRQQGDIEKLKAAVAQPIAGVSATATVRFPVDTLPDPAKAEHHGAYVGQLMDALYAGGIDTVEKARALAERLGVHLDVTGDSAEAYTYTMLKHLGPSDIDAQLKAALAAPLEGVARKGLPVSTDTSRIAAARTEADLKAAILEIANDVSSLTELASRLDAVSYLVPATNHAPRLYVGELVDHVKNTKGGDLSSTVDAFVDALS